MRQDANSFNKRTDRPFNPAARQLVSGIPPVGAFFKGVCLMHWYKFNIGDYRRDTVHLTTLEHGIYRQLLDWYYLDEQPIPTETKAVMRRLCLGSDLVISLENVLQEFFILTEKGYEQKRVRAEIATYKANSEQYAANGKLGGRPRKTKAVLENNQSVTKTKPKRKLTYKPINLSTHELIEAKQTASASRLPPDFEPDLEFAAKEHIADIQREVNSFVDFWTAKSGKDATKLDWQATWRNWCRNSKNKRVNGNGAHQPETFKQRDARDARRRWEQATGSVHPDSDPDDLLRIAL